ncbi:DUF3558 family protein [Nocardia gipuzkoensis]|uniref:DUF3558 family protein n=1 Tax=Nocardia gipuzkoensis TaxID=2749991 RepID=UPI003EDF2947
MWLQEDRLVRRTPMQWIGYATIVLALSVVVPSGCASSDEGAPGASRISEPSLTNPASGGLPDPCAVPAPVLRGFGLQPATALPVDGLDLRVCNWSTTDGRPFHVASVHFAVLSYPKLLSSSRFQGFHPTRVGDSSATLFHDVGDSSERCFIGWATNFGTAWAGIRAFTTRDTPRQDPCQHVQEWANVTFPVLPR